MDSESWRLVGFDGRGGGGLGGRFDAVNGFARFHEVEFVAGDGFDVGGIVLEQIGFFGVKLRDFLLMRDLLFELFDVGGLLFIFLQQRNEGEGAADENGDDDEQDDETIERREEPTVRVAAVLEFFA